MPPFFLQDTDEEIEFWALIEGDAIRIWQLVDLSPRARKGFAFLEFGLYSHIILHTLSLFAGVMDLVLSEIDMLWLDVYALLIVAIVRGLNNN